MAVTIGDLVARLRLDASRFRADIARVESTLRRTSENFKRLGGDLTRFVTVPIAGIAIGAIKASADFETAMVGVAKTVDAPAEAITKLGRQFVALSEQIPVAANRLANIAQIGGQLGIAVKDMVKFTRTIADMGAAARQLPAEEAALGLARLGGLAGVATPDLDRLASAVVELGNEIKTSEKPILDMALRLGTVSKVIGLTAAETVGLAGGLAELGIRSRAGGTALSRAFIKVAKAVSEGTEDVAEFARVAGLTVPEFARLFREDAAEALVVFIEGLGRLKAEGEGAFGVLEKLELEDAQLTRALLSAAAGGDRLRFIIDMSTRAFEENVALTEEAERAYDTLASTFKILFNKARNIAAEFGDRLRPAIKQLTDAADRLLNRTREMVTAFGNLSDKTKNQIVLIAGLAAVLGPLSIILGTVVSIFGGLLGTITLTAGGLAALGIVIVALAGDWRAFRDAAVRALQAVGGEMPTLEQVAQSMSRVVTSVLKFVRREFARLFEDIADGLEGIAPLVGKLGTFFGKLRNFIPTRDLRAAEKALGNVETKVKDLIALRNELVAGRPVEPAGLETAFLKQRFEVDVTDLDAVNERIAQLRIEAEFGERVVALLGRQLEETSDTSLAGFEQALLNVVAAARQLADDLTTTTKRAGRAIKEMAEPAEDAFLALIQGFKKTLVSFDSLEAGISSGKVERFLKDIRALADENLGEAILLMDGLGRSAQQMADALGIGVEQVRVAMKNLGLATQSTLITGFKAAGAAGASALIDGIIDGTLKAEDLLKNFLKALIRNVIFFAFGIRSPAKIGVIAGESVAEGVAKGITMRADLIGAALRNTVGSLAAVGAGIGGAPALAFAGSAGPSITINADFSQIPPPVTPDAIAVNAAWQRVFAETMRQLTFGGFRL